MKQFELNVNLLQEKVILITGASQGIGREIALQYANAGATVILLSRNIARLSKVYDEIKSFSRNKPAIYPLDLSTANPDQYDELAHRIEKEFGQLHGIVHNAALLGGLTPIEHYDIRQWYTVMQTNLHAPFLLTRACIPLLKKSKPATIIFTSSAEGQQGKAYWGAYSVAKAGLTALMQILADELEHSQVRVNAILPNATRTGLRAEAYPAEDPQSLPEAKTLMPHYLHLMSEESKEMNGQVVET